MAQGLKCTLVLAILCLGALLLAVQAEDTRIIGGEVADISKHPYQVSVRVKYFVKYLYTHFCGGVIYSEKIVITAAQGVQYFPPEEITVSAGGNRRDASDGKIRHVERIVMHKDFNSTNYSNDIAILFLKKALPINGITIAPISLASAKPKANAIATVSGYGNMFEYANIHKSEFLRDAEVPIVSFAQCRQIYDEQKAPGWVTEQHVCAGLVETGGKDACVGDAGGPLVVDGQLVGLVSWGYGCARPGYPGVYASIAHFRPWIESTVSGEPIKETYSFLALSMKKA